MPDTAFAPTVKEDEQCPRGGGRNGAGDGEVSFCDQIGTVKKRRGNAERNQTKQMARRVMRS
jgi:hypothetical protein